MIVKELIKELQKYDGDREVILSADEEGNSFNSLCAIADEYEYEHSDRAIYLAKEELTEEKREAGYSEDDLCPSYLEARPAIVLWP